MNISLSTFERRGGGKSRKAAVCCPAAAASCGVDFSVFFCKEVSRGILFEFLNSKKEKEVVSTVGKPQTPLPTAAAAEAAAEIVAAAAERQQQ